MFKHKYSKDCGPNELLVAVDKRDHDSIEKLNALLSTVSEPGAAKRLMEEYRARQALWGKDAPAA